MPRPLRHRLILVRHGETDWNRSGRLQGQQDLPINARGRDQAVAVGRLLGHWFSQQAPGMLAATDLVASPLLRACQTMDLVRVGLGPPIRPYTLDDRLKELSFGRWEGLTWAQVQRCDPQGARARKADKWGFVPPDGESYAMLAVRVLAWLRELQRDTLAVCHGGAARVLLHILAGVSTEKACETEISQGRALVFDGPSHEWI
ncbi:MAG: histidine phosphatase family protein [Methylobacteriaceae bacterium]|nr:histidine phosphatase family protein [Methylobacteriaceae bacterium]